MNEESLNFALQSMSFNNTSYVEYKFLSACGYIIYENLYEIKDMRKPKFPSFEFSLYWATMEFIEDKINEINRNRDIKQGIEQQLIYAGFNKQTANHIEECCNKNTVFDWESLMYWIDVYFEINRKIILSSPLSSSEEQKYLQDQKYLQEFEKNLPNRDWTKRMVEDKEIHVTRVSEKEKLTDLIEELLRKPGTDLQKKKLWYHATCAISLKSLLEYGVELTESKENLDFAHLGFYLSQELDKAKEWALGRDGGFVKSHKQKKGAKANPGSKGAEANPGGKGAILIYEINLDNEEMMGVDLRSEPVKWDLVVRHY